MHGRPTYMLLSSSSSSFLLKPMYIFSVLYKKLMQCAKPVTVCLQYLASCCITLIHRTLQIDNLSLR